MSATDITPYKQVSTVAHVISTGRLAIGYAMQLLGPEQQRQQRSQGLRTLLSVLARGYWGSRQGRTVDDTAHAQRTLEARPVLWSRKQPLPQEV